MFSVVASISARHAAVAAARRVLNVSKSALSPRRPQRKQGQPVITHPLFYEASAGGLDRVQARVSTITAKGLAPLSLAVSTVVRTSASALAAHMAR